MTAESVVTKPLHAIIASDLQDLVDRAVPEGPLEYKATLDLSGESNKLKIADDVSAFANTDGGRILFGIEERIDNGTPVASKVTGLKDGSLVESLANVVHSIIQPTPRFSFERVTVSDGFVLVVDVPPSLTDLHMISGYGKSRYLRRGPTGNVPMRESEVREAYARLLKTRADLDAREERLTASELSIRSASSESIVVTALYGHPGLIDPRRHRGLIQDVNERLLRTLRFDSYPLTLDLKGDGYVGFLPYDDTAESAYVYVAVLKEGLIHSSRDNALFDATNSLADLNSSRCLLQILRTLILARYIFAAVGYSGPSRARYLLRAKKPFCIDMDQQGLRLGDRTPTVGPGEYSSGAVDSHLRTESLEPISKELLDPILHLVGEEESRWFYPHSGMLTDAVRESLPSGLRKLLDEPSS